MFTFCSYSQLLDTIGETAIIHNTLTFAISSLLLDTSKYGVSIEALSKTLQNNGLDIKTDLFRLVIDFIAENLPKVTENLQRTELNPDPRFRSLSWSQKVDIKSSNIDNIRERSFVLDFSHRLPAQGEDEHFELEVSAKELVDLHSGLRDCLRNIERLINKTNN